jgi:hypothetical protein
VSGGWEINWDRASNGGRDKCGGIWIDLLITAAARALAASDALGALNRVVFRDDAPSMVAGLSRRAAGCNALADRNSMVMF